MTDIKHEKNVASKHK